MVFYLIGLGLGSPDDITVKGLNALKTCSFVFLEHYTSILCDSTTEELENYYNAQFTETSIKIQLADRFMVEQNSDAILNHKGCVEGNTALLVVGDPFAATTHCDLLLRAAKEQGFECRVIHNASIMNAVSCCGLQLYSFGATVSIPFWTDSWRPWSFYHKIKRNKDIGLHTLCLLDIKIKEISEQNLIRGVTKYEPPRFMTINDCIDQLMQIETERNEHVFDGDTKCVGLARIGSSTQQIVYGAMRDLKEYDFGKPLHSFVIPGDTHFVEQDVLEMYALHREDDEDEKETKEEIETDHKEDIANGHEVIEQWNGTDFNGIWTLKESKNLEEYLQSEGWSEEMIQKAASGTITQQIIQNEDEMKMKVFSFNGSHSFMVVIGGETVEYVDSNGDCCRMTVEWDEDRKQVVEHTIMTLKGTDIMKKYVTTRSLDENDAKRMKEEITNEDGHKLTRIYSKI